MFIFVFKEWIIKRLYKISEMALKLEVPETHIKEK